MKKTCETKGCENEFIAYSTVQNKCDKCRIKQINEARTKQGKKAMENIEKKVKKMYNRKAKKSDYKEIFRKYWGYEKEEIILCWYSGKVADDIHHIKYKSQGGKDEIENMIPLSRDIHDRAHFKKEPYIQPDELFDIVRGKIENKI